MKNYLLFILTLLLTHFASAQLEKVKIETYYVADSLDATDTTQGRVLKAGSKTYRVYVDLKKGYKLKAIYGNAAHVLKIESTEQFFNNIDRPTAYFGYLIKKNYFASNPTFALDSWLTLGQATTLHNGVPKPNDTDGSILGGTKNGGGSSAVPTGILINNNPLAGDPLTSKDGLLPLPAGTTSAYFDNGFKNANNDDTTAFGPLKVSNQFYSRNSLLQKNAGVVGANLDSNQILVAQVTTLGDLSFQLNISVIDSLGNEINIVAPNGIDPKGDTLTSPYLVYPQSCGCRDMRYLEYNARFACDDSTACKTKKIFGCTDTMACNYNPDANVMMPSFCCYPGYCNDRNLALVCPSLSPYKLRQPNDMADIFPNPTQANLSLQLRSTAAYKEVSYEIYDAFDKLVANKNLGLIQGNSLIEADLTDVQAGIYVVRVSIDGVYTIKKFIKN